MLLALVLDAVAAAGRRLEFAAQIELEAHAAGAGHRAAHLLGRIPVPRLASAGRRRRGGRIVSLIARRRPGRPRAKTNLDLLVPAGEYVEGFREVALSNHRGRAAWFLGKIYPKGGPQFYYPVAIALKWPTVLLLLFFASLILGVRKTCRAPGDLLITSLFGLVFLAFALQSQFRYRRAPHPAAVSVRTADRRRYLGARAQASQRRWRCVVLALCLNAADALRYAPDYLAYFNVFVKPAEQLAAADRQQSGLGSGAIGVARVTNSSIRPKRCSSPTSDRSIPSYTASEPISAANQTLRSAAQSPPAQAVSPVRCWTTLTPTTGSGPISHEQLLDHSIWLFDVDGR